jgi:GT2 family glycosyltransferase
MAKVAIIVPVWNKLECTQTFIDSLYATTQKEDFVLCVVDNASSDKTVPYLNGMKNGKCWNMDIVQNKENLGYVGGINAGIDWMETLKNKPEFVLFVNNDIMFTDKWLDKLVDHMDNKEIGAIGPISNSVVGIQHSSYNNRFQETLHTTAHLIGFFMLVHANVVEKVGKLDTRFGLGFSDDIDYSIRIKKAGYKLAIARDVFIPHEGSASYKELHTKEEDYNKDVEQKTQLLIDKWGKDVVDEAMSNPVWHGTIIALVDDQVPTPFANAFFQLLNSTKEWVNIKYGQGSLFHTSKQKIWPDLGAHTGSFATFLSSHYWFPVDFIKKLCALPTDIILIKGKGGSTVHFNNKSWLKIKENPFLRVDGVDEDTLLKKIAKKYNLSFKKISNGEHTFWKDMKTLPECPPIDQEVHGTIGIPVLETVEWSFLSCMANMISSGKRIYNIVMPWNKHVADARNEIMANRTGDWVLMIDSDHEFPSYLLERLLSHKAPVIAPIAYKKAPPYFPVIYKKAPTWTKEEPLYNPIMVWKMDSLFEVDMVGTGCVLIHNCVLDSLKHTPLFLYTDKVGEDLYFFQKVTEAGWKIVVDPQIPFGHTTQTSVDHFTFHNHNKEMLKKVFGVEQEPTVAKYRDLEYR